ncbi:hypothetical protein EYF80_013628 [Liparis tanakae]|uniref:Uncharacterized protein n=1 Tax=Liparis tanakae TaxID=230148 RepID=A0A4Z2IDX0_9TELE|nr:hypothetical protein EYF80_013628 [Liparis tanakae]
MDLSMKINIKHLLKVGRPLILSPCSEAEGFSSPVKGAASNYSWSRREVKDKRLDPSHLWEKRKNMGMRRGGEAGRRVAEGESDSWREKERQRQRGLALCHPPQAQRPLCQKAYKTHGC